MPLDKLPKLLLVDDDQIIAETLGMLLQTEYDVTLAESREDATRKLALMQTKPDLALVDLGLPPETHTPNEGFALIPELLAHNSKMKILVLSGQDSKANVQHAITLGAIDFVPKPCDAELLKTRLQHQVMLIDSERAEKTSTEQTELIGESMAMHSLLAQVQQFASAPFPVLVEGESGTGKELVAKLLHEKSDRKNKPYYIINCAAFTKELLEAQLFGHAKGAFTGANKEHSGFFEEAAGGTLFLDEIGELPLELQAKLLRVLENGEFYRLGETKARTSTARVVAATNKDMRTEVRDGHFRQDLYHRLSILTIKMPALAEREHDAALLLTHFKNLYAGSVPPFSLNEDAMRLWSSYGFPGNVRELRNLVIRLGTKYPGQTVGVEQLSSEIEIDALMSDTSTATIISNEQVVQQIKSQDFDLEKYLLDIEKQYVAEAMQQAQGNLSQTAKLLKLNRTTLYSRLDKLGLREKNV